MEIATLALGCFWGPEIKFSKLDGVINTEVGYCGGNTEKTSYKEVCYGDTNHAEVVKVEFDNTKISYEEIIRNFDFVSFGGGSGFIIGRRPINLFFIYS